MLKIIELWGHTGVTNRNMVSLETMFRTENITPSLIQLNSSDKRDIFSETA